MVDPPGDDRWLPLAQQLAAEIRTRRKAAGLSQPELAGLIGYTRQYVSLAERPKRGDPSAELVSAIDGALGAEGVLTALRGQADAAHKACRPGAPSNNVADGAGTSRRGPDQSSGLVEVENSKRREFVTSAAAIAFGASLDQPVHRILAAAEPDVPTQVGVGDVRHLRDVVEMLETWDSRAGGGPVRYCALAALRWATAMLESSSCSPEVRQELAATTACLADIASWATFDAGYHEPARQLFLLGLHAARESGDLGIRTHIASCSARQEIQGGNCAGGLELTQLAFAAGDALPPNAIAELYIVKALAYARKLDTAECFRCIGTAINTYQPDSTSDDPPWLRYFTPVKLEGDLANARYDLVLGGADVGDRHGLALIERLSTAFQQCSSSQVRRKAIIATRLAVLLYLEGEQRLGHQMADDAVSLAGQVRSARLADDLRVLLRVLPPGDDSDDHALDLRHGVSAVLAGTA